MRIGIVGAGLAGLTAATDLVGAGHTVVVWEKSRGAGGRTATRRGPEGMRFDHGAPFLHDGDGPLTGLPALASYRLALPDGSSRDEVVGEGSGNAPAKMLAAGLDVRSGVRVGSIEQAGEGWQVADDDGSDLGAYDAVLITAPAPQAAELLRAPAPELAARAETVLFDPCWAAMVAWDAPLDLPFTGAREVDGLAWAAAESPKPGRAPGERWVLQAGADLSREHLELEPDEAGRLLLDRFRAAAGVSVPEPIHLAAHRWRYARPSAPLAEPFLGDGRLLAAGDWCGGTTAGAAVRSGRAAAASLLR